MRYSKQSSILIKKYPNRRLYDTKTSSYITLNELFQYVRKGEDFHVIDVKTKEDLTRSILIQIIVEQEIKGYHLLPIDFLKSIIYFCGNQELLTKFITDSPITKFFDHYHKNNIDIFENSFNILLNPFTEDKKDG